MNADLPNGNLLLDKVHIKLDMLCAPMMNGVVRQVDGGHIVAVQESRLVDLDVEFVEKMSKPAALGCCVCHATVLGLRT